MNLNKFAVSVIAALLVKRGLRRSGADNGVGRFTKNCANDAGGHDDGVGREGANFHAAQVQSADASAHAICVKDRAQDRPMLVFGDAALCFITANLLVQRIKKLLACGSAGKCRAIEKGAAKAAEIEQTLWRPIEGDAHT